MSNEAELKMRHNFGCTSTDNQNSCISYTHAPVHRLFIEKMQSLFERNKPIPALSLELLAFRTPVEGKNLFSFVIKNKPYALLLKESIESLKQEDDDMNVQEAYNFIFIKEFM